MSMRGRTLAVNLLALGACACVAPSTPSADVVGGFPEGAPRGWQPASRNGFDEAFARHPELRVSPGDEEEAPPPGPGGPPMPDRVLPQEVGAASITDASISYDYGAALTERLADFSRSDRNQYGVSLLTADELFGDGVTDFGLCEWPEVYASLRDDGEDYDAALRVYPYTAFVGDPEPMLVSITAACEAGVAATGGDVDAAVSAGDCDDSEAHTFFADGSDCRACVEGDGGDYAACQDAGSCPAQAPMAVWAENDAGEVAWYRGVFATAWACAPDYVTSVYLMADYDDDGVIPRAFDHYGWYYACTPFWDPDQEAPVVECVGSDDPDAHGTLAEGLFGFVSWLRPSDDDSTLGWRGRQYFVDSITFDTGAEISWSWAANPGLAPISAPRIIDDTNGDGQPGEGDVDYGFGGYGLGLDPHQQNPDGSSMARDWLAAAVMKTASTHNGTPFVIAQRSRCADWEGPGDDGSYRCAAEGQPEGGWLNDVNNTYVDGERTRPYMFPLTTLASTGLMDPDVPGGIVVDIAGSSALANPDWDDCTLPHAFVPDLAPYEDWPDDWDGPTSIEGHAWNFDAHADRDFRVVFNTNQARGWCGGTADGGGRSGLDLLPPPGN